jgi:hypothetical protein
VLVDYPKSSKLLFYTLLKYNSEKVMNSVDKIVDKKSGLFALFKIITLSLPDKINVK